MAWQHLHSELDELFDELQTRAGEMSEANERMRSWANSYMRTYWALNPARYQAHLQRERARKRAYASDPEWLARDRARARERMRRLRARACP